MESKEHLIRAFYAARARRDWAAVRDSLAADVVWHEPREEYRGRDRVAGLLEQFVRVTDGSFMLEPSDCVTTDDHVATNVRWSARRGDTQVDGNDLAVYRVADGAIAEAWFFMDGYDPVALKRVFSGSDGF
jgi:uncharacterized protein